VNQINLPGIPDSSAFRWGRLPFQAVLIAWAWWYTRPDNLKQQVSLIPPNWTKGLTQDLK
jgi:uncharacterized membrane protein